MMTCRLLCALLVLALCICPSVCVTANDIQPEKNSGQPPTPPKNLVDNTGDGKDPNAGSGAGQDSKGKPGSIQVSDKGENSVTEPGALRPGNGKGGGGGPVSEKSTLSTGQAERGASGEPGSADRDNNLTVSGNSKEMVEQKPLQGPEEPKNNEEVKVQTPNATTTTTTKAPSNTAIDTEAPTTTTTRAPSRLREIDGSLSSSAWVCAPLLLAVSALAYTAVG
ncbi:mucin TcMUCII, putative [Trypanosoma cruzi marinkellei]|uniref:Mucin TcMUCII, putative n=1 Tax=Trypanosoma cruzi marinkellei TaxID=85056 RepID=K2NK04_TRYCR|nr:mucin TcMUCII, putative [Trypanosoma cruzi marinkellei]